MRAGARPEALKGMLAPKAYSFDNSLHSNWSQHQATQALTAADCQSSCPHEFSSHYKSKASTIRRESSIRRILPVDKDTRCTGNWAAQKFKKKLLSIGYRTLI